MEMSGLVGTRRPFTWRLGDKHNIMYASREDVGMPKFTSILDDRELSNRFVSVFVSFSFNLFDDIKPNRIQGFLNSVPSADGHWTGELIS